MKKLFLLSITLLTSIGLQGKNQDTPLPSEDIFGYAQKYATLIPLHRDNKKPEALLSKNLLSTLSDNENELNKASEELDEAEKKGPAWWHFFEYHTRIVAALTETKREQGEKIETRSNVLKEVEKIENVLKYAKDTKKGGNILHIILRKFKEAKTSHEAFKLAKLNRALMETINKEADLWDGQDYANNQGKTPRDLFVEMTDKYCTEKQEGFNADKCMRCHGFANLP